MCAGTPEPAAGSCRLRQSATIDSASGTSMTTPDSSAPAMRTSLSRYTVRSAHCRPIAITDRSRPTPVPDIDEELPFGCRSGTVEPEEAVTMATILIWVLLFMSPGHRLRSLGSRQQGSGYPHTP